MGRELRLPVELESFISRPGPLTMIIRGPPGSGKTTLSLAILEAFYGRKMFITGRRSRSGVLEDFPWLGSVEGHEIEVVDTVSGSDGEAMPLAPEPEPGSASPATVHANVMQSLPPELRQTLGRRGSGGTDLARQLGQLPTGLRRALAHSASDQRVMLVVDSWDAFVEECLDLLPTSVGPRLHREELERLALRMIARGRAHLVLVLERPDPTQLDYLVDGILTTTHEVSDTHPERWITMPKLRGVRIENETYPYTLEGGRFKCIAPESIHGEHAGVFFEPDPEPVPEAIWPGSRTFCEAFGRLRLGVASTFETDEHVTESVVETLLFPLMAAVLAGGGRLLYVPAPSQRLTEFWDAFSGSFTPEQIQAQLRIVAPGATLAAEHPLRRCLVNVPRAASGGTGPPTQSPIPRAREFVTTPPGAERPQNLVVVATDGLRLIAHYSGSAFTPEGLPVMVRSYAVGARPHLLFVARSDDPLLAGIKMIASFQLRLTSRSGRTFASGLKPVTPSYSLTPRSAAEGRAYGLLRIV